MTQADPIDPVRDRAKPTNSEGAHYPQLRLGVTGADGAPFGSGMPTAVSLCPRRILGRLRLANPIAGYGN